MPPKKTKHEPISYDKFAELVEANIKAIVNFEDSIKTLLVGGEFVGSISGESLDFFEKFDEDDGKKMALAVIFFLGVKLGRILGSEKEKMPEPQKPKNKKGGNGQPKN